MSIQITILRDEVTGLLADKEHRLTDLRMTLEAAGLQIVSITQRAFTDSAMRMAPWPPKRDGTPATLRQKGTLWASIRIVSLTAHSVTVGSDRVYAAAQQFGATIVPKDKKVLVFMAGGVKVFARKVVLPPRPFFPVDAQGNVWSVAQQKVLQAMQASLGV